MTDKNIVLCETDNRGIANVHLNRPHKNNAYNGNDWEITRSFWGTKF